MQLCTCMFADKLSTMSEKEVSVNCKRSRIKQSISVPFLWEEKPGTPKKDWKPSGVRRNLVVPPVKLVASVPFIWEEKPGTPLPNFSQPPLAPSLYTPEFINFPSPPVHTQGNDNNWSDSCASDDNSSHDEQDETLESDFEVFNFHTDGSNSAPSLLANGLISSKAISTAVPVLTENNSWQLQTPASPASESDSSRSSYETGATSLVGAAFLEHLFPLLSPTAGFFEKVSCTPMDPSYTPQKVVSKDSDHGNNCSLVIRRPHTLGELIMMSRRRTHQTKAAQTRKQDLSMELMKQNALGCCIFRTGNTVSKLQQKSKRELRLKLM